MIRTKILGPLQFSHGQPLHLSERNCDLGHFSIGPGDVITMIVDEALHPPKHVWIRAKVYIEPCPAIPIIGKDQQFIWQDKTRCAAIKLESAQILHAQKGDEQTLWQLSKVQPSYTHAFAIAATIYDTAEGIHLWPCGGSMDSILEAEQLFAQVGSDAPEIFTNKYSSWKRHLTDSQDVIFESPNFKTKTLLDELKAGKFLAQIERNGQRFSFASCRAEPSNSNDFIDILCERINV